MSERAVHPIVCPPDRRQRKVAGVDLAGRLYVDQVAPNALVDVGEHPISAAIHPEDTITTSGKAANR